MGKVLQFRRIGADSWQLLLAHWERIRAEHPGDDGAALRAFAAFCEAWDPDGIDESASGVSGAA